MRAWGIAMAMALAWPCAPVRAGLPETPRLRQYTVAEGLPSNRVNGVAQDRRGYLWIATSDGLARFDGVGFRVWRAEQGLRDNFVWAVHVDARDRVWVATRGAGLGLLDARLESFTWLDERTPGVVGRDVWSLTSTANGDLWFGTAQDGLYRLRDGRVRRWLPEPGNPDSLPSPSILRIVPAPRGGVWVATPQGAAYVGDAGVRPVVGGSLQPGALDNIQATPDGTLWLGARGRLHRATPDGRIAPVSVPLGGPRVLNLLMRDRAGAHWYDLVEGLGVDDEAGIAVLPLYSAVAQSLVRPTWSGALEDHEGGLWFASSTSGLWYLPPRWRQFSVLSRRMDDPASLGNAQVLAIAPARDGSFWLSGSGGVLDRFDSETGAVQHVVEDIGAGYLATAALEDRHGIVWVSTMRSLARLDPRTGALRRWMAGEADGALQGEHARILQADDGLLWLSTESGMQVRNEAGEVLLGLRPGTRGLPEEAVVHDLARTPRGGIWAGTSHGLLLWDETHSQFEPVAGTGSAAVHGVALDERGDLWLARVGAIERYRIDAGRPRLLDTFGADAGFPRVAPSGLLVDGRGIAWVTTVRGLVRLDPATRSSRIYGVRDGLPSQEFTDPPVARPADGRILVGSQGGLVLFDPAVVRPARVAPLLALESLDVMRAGERTALPLRDGALRHDDRDLRLRLRVLAFSDPGAHAYRTRLLGFDPGWIDSPQGERTFSQLQPGQYRLQYTGRAADRVWAPVREVRFTVQPPWWRTGTAITLFALAFAGLLATAALALRRRLRRQHAFEQAQQQRRLAQEASEAKTRFLATFGHEVRTPMTGVLGMSELLLDTSLDARQRSHVAAIRSAGEHLLRLLDDALDLARIDSGRLDIVEAPFDLHALLHDLERLVAPLAARRGLAFSLDIADDVPRGVLGDASRIKQVLLNLLNNALKFTQAGGITLHAALEAGRVRLDVADTGPGLTEELRTRLFGRFEQGVAGAPGGSGLGLAICHELVTAMRGTIAVASLPGEGTRFSVRLPLARAELPDAGREVVTPEVPARCILLVEDDPTVAEVMRGLLGAQGHAVHHAANALDALALTRIERFDIGLVDLDLPGIDGFALARQLRLLGFTAPLVAVTARSDARSEPDALAAGFDRFLRKPVTGAQLAEVIAGVVPATA